MKTPYNFKSNLLSQKFKIYYQQMTIFSKIQKFNNNNSLNTSMKMKKMKFLP